MIGSETSQAESQHRGTNGPHYSKVANKLDSLIDSAKGINIRPGSNPGIPGWMIAQLDMLFDTNESYTVHGSFDSHGINNLVTRHEQAAQILTLDLGRLYRKRYFISIPCFVKKLDAILLS